MLTVPFVWDWYVRCDEWNDLHSPYSINFNQYNWTRKKWMCFCGKAHKFVIKKFFIVDLCGSMDVICVYGLHLFAFCEKTFLFSKPKNVNLSVKCLRRWRRRRRRWLRCRVRVRYFVVFFSLSFPSVPIFIYTSNERWFWNNSNQLCVCCTNYLPWNREHELTSIRIHSRIVIW